MNPPARASLFISICLLLVVTFSGSAQQSSADKTESLRLKIAELESTDLKSKSAIVQDLYKRTRQCCSDRTATTKPRLLPRRVWTGLYILRPKDARCT